MRVALAALEGILSGTLLGSSAGLAVGGYNPYLCLLILVMGILSYILFYSMIQQGLPR